MLRLLVALLVIYVGFLVFIAAAQNKLTYFPTRYPEADLVAAAARAGLVPWRDPSGEIIGWRSARPPAGTTSATSFGSASPPPDAGKRAAPIHRAIMFHGNGGMALDRADFVSGFENLGSGATWEVYLFEYPGYGARPGKHAEKTILAAATRAVSDMLETDQRPLFLIGESLGAGVACQMAAAFPEQTAGLFLITPFTTLADVAAHHYSLVPVRLLMRERYDNLSALKKYRGPVAFLFAGQDEVVPARISRRLFETYTGPKKLWSQDRAGHNTLVYDAALSLWREISDFLTGSPAGGRDAGRR